MSVLSVEDNIILATNKLRAGVNHPHIFTREVSGNYPYIRIIMNPEERDPNLLIFFDIKYMDILVKICRDQIWGKRSDSQRDSPYHKWLETCFKMMRNTITGYVDFRGTDNSYHCKIYKQLFKKFFEAEGLIVRPEILTSCTGCILTISCIGPWNYPGADMGDHNEITKIFREWKAYNWSKFENILRVVLCPPEELFTYKEYVSSEVII